jgi:putative endonuclease
MSRNRKIGNLGEEIATNYLIGQGYEIVEKNWTTGHKEIDIITRKNDIFVFIEVKTRTSLKQGMPEESISTKKISSVTEAARIYLFDKKYKDIRFDVVSIFLPQNATHELLHIQDAFY